MYTCPVFVQNSKELIEYFRLFGWSASWRKPYVFYNYSYAFAVIGKASEGYKEKEIITRGYSW